MKPSLSGEGFYPVFFSHHIKKILHNSTFFINILIVAAINCQTRFLKVTACILCCSSVFIVVYYFLSQTGVKTVGPKGSG